MLLYKKLSEFGKAFAVVYVFGEHRNAFFNGINLFCTNEHICTESERNIKKITLNIALENLDCLDNLERVSDRCV